ncbi:MAG: response regulator [Deltaproteobacteria bacterium]|nr:response regulator [Deltaproteobacteria bacterium]
MRNTPWGGMPLHPPPPGEETTNRPLCVYLLEDNPGDQVLIEAYLASEGKHTVVPFASMAELTLRGTPPDVVLLDLRLPDARDEEVVRRTRLVLPDTPMVVLTGVEDGEVARRCLELGADDYIEKNQLSTEVLRRAVAFAVARGRARGLQTRLQAAERLATLGRLAAGVAHEINNPATSILVNLELVTQVLGSLLCSPKGEGESLNDKLLELRAMTQDAKLATERIARIVKELSGFSRMENDKTETFWPANVLDRVVALVSHRVPRGVAVTKSAPETLMAVGDIGKVEQILVNLFSNACDAMMGRTGSIHLEAVSEGPHVVFAVDDEGPGVPPSSADRIFDPFFTTKARGQGTGLGLAISVEAAQRMGGQLRLARTSGAGSRFELLLPAAETEKARATSEHVALSGRRWRVLLVDDDTSVASSWSRVLAAHDTTVAASAEEALQILDDGAVFDVVLCDLIMPGIGGVGFFQHVQAHRKQMLKRLILCTGGLVDDSAKAFVLSTGLDVLEKPVRADDLLACVDKVALAAEAADNP